MFHSWCNFRPQRRAGRILGLQLFALAALVLRAPAVDILTVEQLHPTFELPANAAPPVGVAVDKPGYPASQMMSGLGGRVTLQFVIDETGRVVNPVVEESNNPWFERVAIRASLKWKFKPATVGGQPVAVRARQVLKFNLVGDDDESSERGLWQTARAKPRPDDPPELQWQKPPQPVATTFPVYPFEDLLAKAKSQVKITLLIGPAGRVVESRVQEATTPAMGYALQAMLDTWRFTPPLKKDGTPCFAAVTLSQAFDPSGKKGDVPQTLSGMEIVQLIEKKSGRIVASSELDRPSRPLSRRPPVYPTALLAARKTGTAAIEFFIDDVGDAQLPRVVRATEPEFGYAAAQAIAAWRFEAPLKDGKPVVARAQIELEFTLPPSAAKPAAPPASK